MNTVMTLILCALATARLTRLVVEDRITLAPRAWLLRRLPEDGMLAYLIVCPWCVSVYVGAGVGAVGGLAGWWSWVLAPFAALAFSYVAGFLASREGE